MPHSDIGCYFEDLIIIYEAQKAETVPSVVIYIYIYIRVIYIYIYIRVSVGLRNTKECSMSYRQSEMYKLTTYLKDLPLQSVSSKKNLLT